MKSDELQRILAQIKEERKTLVDLWAQVKTGDLVALAKESGQTLRDYAIDNYISEGDWTIWNKIMFVDQILREKYYFVGTILADEVQNWDEEKLSDFFRQLEE